MRMLMRSTLLLVLILASFLSARGAVPGLISYQGRVTDSEGQPLADGMYDFTFAMYDQKSGGEMKWSETQTGVTVADGLFAVLLGSVTPIADSVFDGANRFLEVRVEGEAISPRTQIVSTAYAQRVGSVDGALGGEIAAPVYVLPLEFLDSLARSSAASPLTVTSSPRISFGFSGDGDPEISLYEPIDSRTNPLTGAVETKKKIQLSQDGIFIFGNTELDTNLVVAPNGDIVGVGQITMGQNSSPGLQTTVLGFENTGNGDSSTIGGGSANVTNGTISTIGGGYANLTDGEGATIGGGALNDAAGWYATIAGGYANSAAGDYASIPGGQENTADGLHSYAAGHRAKALHNGTFVWADQTEEDFTSTGEDQFLIRAGGGVGIGTDSPVGLLDVVGRSGDSSVNLPSDAIAAPEILDEPGIASDRLATGVVLTQDVSTVEQLLTVTITTPAPGYIVVRSSATLECVGTNKRNQAYMQIDESPGGGLVSPYFGLAGAGDYDSPNTAHYFDISVERVFAKPAGAHAFYLEAMAHPENGDDAVTTIEQPYIIATYYPTSYGSVVGLASAEDARQFDEAVPVGAINALGDPVGSPSEQLYRVDLRELELKAMRARLEAEKAEKELLEARLRNRNSSPGSVAENK
jgi:hypothetical protein